MRLAGPCDGRRGRTWSWVLGLFRGHARSGYHLRCPLKPVRRHVPILPHRKHKEPLNRGWNRPWRKFPRAQRKVIFCVYSRSLGLPLARPCPSAYSRASCLCAGGNTIILLHPSHIKFPPEKEVTSVPLLHSGQWSPGFGIGGLVGFFMLEGNYHRLEMLTTIAAKSNHPFWVDFSATAEPRGWQWLRRDIDVAINSGPWTPPQMTHRDALRSFV